MKRGFSVCHFSSSPQSIIFRDQKAFNTVPEKCRVKRLNSLRSEYGDICLIDLRQTQRECLS